MLKKSLLAVVLLAALPGAAQTLRKGPPEVEAALRARVDKFYTLFQDAKFRQAEALVAEESRDLFYNMSKAPIRGYRFESIDFAPDFKEAMVLVSCVSVTTRTAAAGIMVPVSGKWKLIDGQWYLVIEVRKTTPFGPMHWDDPRTAKADPVVQRPSLETLAASSVEVVPQKLIFKKREGEDLITQVVVVKNHLPGLLTVEIEGEKLPGLAMLISGKEVPGKGQISFVFNYSPQAGKLAGTKEVVFKIQPLNQAFAVQMEFE